MKKATEEQFNELHNLVTEEFLKRVRSGEATAHELKAACDWLVRMTLVESLTREIHYINWQTLCQK